MKNAKLLWQDNVPFSQSFNEVYFSSSGGLEESKHVFLKGNNLPFLWENNEIFTICECGFGTGLNFLNTWKMYEECEKKPKYLYFISIEKEPLSSDDLKKVNSFFPTLKPYAKKLQRKYPPLSEGFHFLEFENVKLLLCFLDVKEALSQLTCKINAWYLDGFSPAKNPEMWDLKTLSLLKNLSYKNATLASYSVARVLKENLHTLGFEVEKKEGFGQKKHMLKAYLKDESNDILKPWFALPKATKEKHALVLGAGIAGSALAYTLAKSGWQVDIIDRHEKAGQGASGNHCGVVAPLITKPKVILGKMYERAFLQSLQWYEELVEDEGAFCGVKHYAFNDIFKNRWQIWKNQQNEIFSCEKDKNFEYFFIKKAGYLQPYKMCEKLVNSHVNINFNGNCDVKTIRYKDEKYEVKMQNNKLFSSKVLIIALGDKSVSFLPNNTFYTQRTRGQITLLSKILDTSVPLCAEGYICPYIGGKQVIGATYYKDDIYEKARESDNLENLDSIKEFIDIKNVEILGSRVSFRSSTNDRFPIIGAVFDEKYYKENYKALPWKKHKPHLFPKAKYLPNLYISTAYSSRGLIGAIMGANIIKASLEGTPIPVEKDILYALHPARFTIRRLLKQQVW